MRKLIVPTDFSQNAKHALFIAAEIARKNKVPLGIMHTNTAVAYAPVLPDYGASGLYNMQEYYDMAADEFRALKREISERPGFEKLPIDTRVEEGLLYTSIQRVVEEDQADLIVMGTKGATGALEFFVGSNTEKVIRTAPCPVLAIPEHSGEFKLDTVVLASSLRDDQAAAFKYLAGWQKIWHFKVEVVYLNNPGSFKSKKDIDEKVAAFAQEAGLHKTKAYININAYNEEDGILEFARHENADLIAMGTHQRKGLSHLLFGSMAENTSNHSDIPVLCIPLR